MAATVQTSTPVTYVPAASSMLHSSSVPYGNGSYVPAAPQAGPSLSYVPPMAQNLTEGIPDPESIEQQKRAYERGLDAELEQTRKLAEEQLKQQTNAIKVAAEQQIAMYKAQIEQAIKQQELSLDHQWQQQQVELQQAFLRQKAALEQQASSLAMEYQQRKMHEELLRKQADMQREMAEMQRRLQLELQEHQQQQVNLQQQHAVQRQQHQEELAAQQAKYLGAQGHGSFGHVWAAPMQPGMPGMQGMQSQVVYQAPAAVPAVTSARPSVRTEVAEAPPAEPMVLGTVQPTASYPVQDLQAAYAPSTLLSGMPAAHQACPCGTGFMADSLYGRGQRA